jgi:hypothetical protein
MNALTEDQRLERVEELKEQFRKPLKTEQMFTPGKELYDLLTEDEVFINKQYEVISAFFRLAKLNPQDSLEDREDNMERLVRLMYKKSNVKLWLQLYYFSDARYQEITEGKKFSRSKTLKKLVEEMKDYVTPKPKVSRVVHEEEDTTPQVEEEPPWMPENPPQLPVDLPPLPATTLPPLPPGFPSLAVLPPPPAPPLPSPPVVTAPPFLEPPALPPPPLPVLTALPTEPPKEPWWHRLLPMETSLINAKSPEEEEPLEDIGGAKAELVDTIANRVKEVRAKAELLNTVATRAQVVRANQAIINETRARLKQQSDEDKKRQREAAKRELKEAKERSKRQRVETIDDLIANVQETEGILSRSYNWLASFAAEKTSSLSEYTPAAAGLARQGAVYLFPPLNAILPLPPGEYALSPQQIAVLEDIAAMESSYAMLMASKLQNDMQQAYALRPTITLRENTFFELPFKNDAEYYEELDKVRAKATNDEERKRIEDEAKRVRKEKDQQEQRLLRYAKAHGFAKAYVDMDKPLPSSDPMTLGIYDRLRGASHSFLGYSNRNPKLPSLAESRLSGFSCYNI